MRILKIFFTIVYFLVFCFLIDLIFSHTISAITDILAIICWVIAFIASVGIADYTVEKIKENIKNN